MMGRCRTATPRRFLELRTPETFHAAQGQVYNGRVDPVAISFHQTRTQLRSHNGYLQSQLQGGKGFGAHTRTIQARHMVRGLMSETSLRWFRFRVSALGNVNPKTCALNPECPKLEKPRQMLRGFVVWAFSLRSEPSLGFYAQVGDYGLGLRVQELFTA